MTADRDFPDFAAALDAATMEAYGQLDDLAGLGLVVEVEPIPPGDAMLRSAVHYRRPPSRDVSVLRSVRRIEGVFGDGLTEWGDLLGASLGVRVRGDAFDTAAAAIAAAIRLRVQRIRRELPKGATLEVDWIVGEVWSALMADS